MCISYILILFQNDLAVQKKKIEEVETWLKMHIFQRQPKQVILVKLAARDIKPYKRAGFSFTVISKKSFNLQVEIVYLLHYKKSVKNVHQSLYVCLGLMLLRGAF